MSVHQHVEKPKAHAMQQHHVPPQVAPQQQQQQQQDPGQQIQLHPQQGAVEMPPPYCYFLELPPELRELIYSELLLPTAITITFPDRTAPTQAFAHVPYDGKQLHPTVLQTSRQIYNEAILFLYRPSILHLGTVSTKHPRAKPFRIGGLHFVRHLEELRINLSCTPTHMGLDVSQSKFLGLNLIPTDLAIKRLFIGMPNHNNDKDMKATMILAWAWFKRLTGTESTIVHLRSPPSGRASRCIGHDGVWRDCTSVFNEDGDSDFGHNASECYATLRLPRYFKLIEMAHLAVVEARAITQADGDPKEHKEMSWKMWCKYWRDTRA